MCQPRLASPTEIISHLGQSKADIVRSYNRLIDPRVLTNSLARVQMLLDVNWEPSLIGDISDACVIIGPLASTTFSYICNSSHYVDSDLRTALFSQLVDAVAFLHSHSISHRDIKPSNVLIKSFDPPAAMLTDFGCASDKRVMEYASVGTIMYLAPEQMAGNTHTQAVDLWATGLVAAELMNFRLGTERILSDNKRFWNFHQNLSHETHVMAVCCKHMLNTEPGGRMSAAEALSLLQKYVDRQVTRPNPLKRSLVETT